MAKQKGGRKLSRGTIRRKKTPAQMARTARNKHNAAARILRRKSPEWMANKAAIQKENRRALISA